LTSVGGGRNPETVGVTSTTTIWVGVASTTKVAEGDASGTTGGRVGEATGVNTGSGVAVAVLSGGGTIEDWNVERANAPPEAAKVSATARAMTVIRIVRFCGRVRKVQESPCAIRMVRL
jgi:hypothetical protein